MVEWENGRFEDHYKVNEDKVKIAQNALRKFMDRQRRRAEEMGRRERELAAMKIQGQYRKYRHSRDQQELSEWRWRDGTTRFYRGMREAISGTGQTIRGGTEGEGTGCTGTDG